MASVLDRLRDFISGRRYGAQERATKIGLIPPRDPAIVALLGSYSTGEPVINSDSILGLSAMYCGVNLISSVLGAMDLNQWEEDNAGQLKISKDDIANVLLSERPNAHQTPDVFIEQLQARALVYGNGFAEIIRADGMPVSLEPLESSMVIGYEYDNAGELSFTVKEDPGTSETRTIKNADMFHIPFFPIKGPLGEGLAHRARESMKLSISAEQFGNAFFQNGATLQGIITHPMALSKEAGIRLQERINEKHQGTGKAFNLAVLDEGMKYQATSVAPETGQFMETRGFQITECARWLNVPPVLLYDLSAGTESNVEQLNLQFMAYTMSTWMKRWANQARMKLTKPDPTRTISFRFNRDQIQTIDQKTRNESYASGRNGGWYSLNDILRKEGGLSLLPNDIGESHLAPSTMKTLERTDFGNRVDMDAVGKVVAFIEQMRPVSMASARELIDGAIPDATDKFVNGLLEMLRKKGLVN